MSRNKHQDVRIRVLDQCFRNRSRQYTIDDLLDACNDAIGDIYGGGISIRTIRDDIKFMRDSQGYNAPIVTKEWDGKKCIYFYSDYFFWSPSLLPASSGRAGSNGTICSTGSYNNPVQRHILCSLDSRIE